MKIRIVSHGDITNWILGKFARKLEEYLSLNGLEVSVGQSTDPTADINHHIVHYEPLQSLPGIQTQMVTHIDTIQKLNMLKRQLHVAEMGICMSRETVDKLSATGIPRLRLCYVNPAHDSVMRPRRCRIGITCRIHVDGRKREWFLGDLADHLEPVHFEFIVMGNGWSPQVNRLKKKGFIVTYYPNFDYNEYIHLIPSLDYYLYFGEDEGQMGFVDAVAAGVETIVTPQGYHLDVEDGISYPYHSFDELLQIFIKLSEKREHLSAKVTDWTWQNYAQKHLEIWRHLIAVRTGMPLKPLICNSKDGVHSIFLDKEKCIRGLQRRKFAFMFHLYAGFVKQKGHMQWGKIKRLFFHLK